jgi:hypothetical protein
VTIGANIVRQGDEFSHWIDEKGEHFKHVPQYTEDERPLRVVYAYAVTKDGGVYFEALSAAEVEKFRGLSRAGRDDSPWAMWPDEMSKVRAIKRLTKRLPMSADAIAAIERDNLREAGMLGVAQQRSGIDALNSALAGGGDAGNGGAPALTHDPSQPAEFFNTSINVNFADPVGGALVGNATGGDAPQGQQGAATQAASKPDAEAIAALTDDWIAAIDAADSEAALNDAAQRAGKALMKAPAAARERVIAALEVAGAKFGAAATKKGNGKADKPAEKAAD